MASMTGHTECVEQLLIADSEGINVVDSQGQSSVHVAWALFQLDADHAVYRAGKHTPVAITVLNRLIS